MPCSRNAVRIGPVRSLPQGVFMTLKDVVFVSNMQKPA